MMKIELAELRSMGASQKALDFYNGTDCVRLWREDDGLYHAMICGQEETHALPSSLIGTLEACADAWGISEEETN